MMNEKLDPELKAIIEARDYGNAFNDISFWIGVSLIGLGVLNGITDVPDAFIIGAGLAGFCFTVTDTLTLVKFGKKFITLFTAIGTLCFFLLPIVLLVFPALQILNFFKFLADMGTFYALGFVMVTFTIKSHKAKIRYATENTNYLKKLSSDNKRMKIRQIEFGKEIEDYRNQIAKLEEDFELLKADLKTNKPKEDSSQ